MCLTNFLRYINVVWGMLESFESFSISSIPREYQNKLAIFIATSVTFSLLLRLEGWRLPYPVRLASISFSFLTCVTWLVGLPCDINGSFSMIFHAVSSN